jgi:hypothetical protein
MDNLLSALYSFPDGYLFDRFGTVDVSIFGRDIPVTESDKVA